jgi:hypothetical protein
MRLCWMVTLEAPSTAMMLSSRCTRLRSPRIREKAVCPSFESYHSRLRDKREHEKNFDADFARN